jgi:hypothetical protein
MSEDASDKMTREERLAAKLRENLRRRKAQGREMRDEMRDSETQDLPKAEDES